MTNEESKIYRDNIEFYSKFKSFDLTDKQIKDIIQFGWENATDIGFDDTKYYDFDDLFEDIKEIVEQIRDYFKNSNEIFRFIYANSKFDIDKSNLGNYWTYDLKYFIKKNMKINGSSVIDDSNGKNLFLVTAIADMSKINIPRTIYHNYKYTNEREITIYDDYDMKVVEIEPVDYMMESKLTKLEKYEESIDKSYKKIDFDVNDYSSSMFDIYHPEGFSEDTYLAVDKKKGYLHINIADEEQGKGIASEIIKALVWRYGEKEIPHGRIMNRNVYKMLNKIKSDPDFIVEDDGDSIWIYEKGMGRVSNYDSTKYTESKSLNESIEESSTNKETDIREITSYIWSENINGVVEVYNHDYNWFHNDFKDVFDIKPYFKAIDDLLKSPETHKNRVFSKLVVDEYSLLNTEAPPIIVNGNQFLDGYHRLLAYKKKGIREIPVVDISKFLKIDWAEVRDGLYTESKSLNDDEDLDDSYEDSRYALMERLGQVRDAMLEYCKENGYEVETNSRNLYGALVPSAYFSINGEIQVRISDHYAKESSGWKHNYGRYPEPDINFVLTSVDDPIPDMKIIGDKLNKKSINESKQIVDIKKFIHYFTSVYPSLMWEYGKEDWRQTPEYTDEQIRKDMEDYFKNSTYGFQLRALQNLTPKFVNVELSLKYAKKHGLKGSHCYNNCLILKDKGLRVSGGMYFNINSNTDIDDYISQVDHMLKDKNIGSISHLGGYAHAFNVDDDGNIIDVTTVKNKLHSHIDDVVYMCFPDDEFEGFIGEDSELEDEISNKINSLPIEIDFDFFLNESIIEAKYQGREVTLNKPSKGDVKKYKVYVKDPETGNVKKVNFGDKEMEIKRDDPERRKSFRARHKCDQKKDKTTPGYWSCKFWGKTPVKDLLENESNSDNNIKQLISAGVEFTDEGKAIVYRGANVSKNIIKNLRYGDYLSAVEHGVDFSGNAGASSYGKNIVRFELNPEDLKITNGELQYIGQSKSLKGKKYPLKIYKAYNDYYGSNYTSDEIDKEEYKKVRMIASMALSGGSDEFDELMKQFSEYTIKEKHLTSDFKFGFELECIVGSDTGYEELNDNIIDFEQYWKFLFNEEPNNDEDLSIKPTEGKYKIQQGIEFQSPVLDFNIKNIQNCIELLTNMKDYSIYVNESCGFHTHISYPSLNDMDMIWIFSNLAIDESIQNELLEMNVDGINIELFDEKFANKEILNKLKSEIEQISIEYDIEKSDYEYDSDELFKIFDSFNKNVVFNLHEQGTIEWRGGRTFLNDGKFSTEATRTKAIAEYFTKLYKLIRWIKSTLDKKYIMDVPKDLYLSFFNSLQMIASGSQSQTERTIYGNIIIYSIYKKGEYIPNVIVTDKNGKLINKYSNIQWRDGVPIVIDSNGDMFKLDKDGNIIIYED